MSCDVGDRAAGWRQCSVLACTLSARAADLLRCRRCRCGLRLAVARSHTALCHAWCTRRRLAVVCYVTAAACLFAGTRCDDPLALAALWSTSAGVMHVTLPNWWSVIIPQAGRHTATLFGLANGVGCFGALASLGLVPEYADWRERSGLTGRAAWDPIFDVYVCVLLLNAVAWSLYRFTPLPEPQTQESESW